MRALLLLLVPFILSSSAVTEIKWNATQPLKWSDFSGKIDAASEYDAWTWSGFNYTYTWEVADGGPIVECDVYAFFDPAQSWVKKDKMSDELLRHEQVHFNISELHARLFKEKVDSYPFSMEVESEIQQFYDMTFERLLDMQMQYDDETDHGKIKDEQERWAGYVDAALEEFE